MEWNIVKFCYSHWVPLRMEYLTKHQIDQVRNTFHVTEVDSQQSSKVSSRWVRTRICGTHLAEGSTQGTEGTFWCLRFSPVRRPKGFLPVPNNFWKSLT